MGFEFATAGRILFGEGMVREVPAAAAAMGSRAMLVTGSSPERSAPLFADLEGAGVAAWPCPIDGEPTIKCIRTATEQACEARCEMVIAIGGGSAIDAGKAVAAMIANPGDPLDYLEVIGRAQPLAHPAVPLIAIPTTAGTGSEVTRNAVLGSPERGVKASLRSAGMLPRLAVVDPELTYSLPRTVTASTGLDALTQLIEPYVSVRANPMTDQFCVEGMRRATLAGAETIEHGNEGTLEIFKLMAEHHVAFCPTLTAGGGRPTKPGEAESPASIRKRAMFKAALESGVTILSGSDVGTFPHGDNAREIERMVDYGMP